MIHKIIVFVIIALIGILHNVSCQQQQQNKLVVDCLNLPDNTGSFFVNAFFANTAQGFRAQALYGRCSPGSFVTFNLNELVGYLWIKGQSKDKAYFKVTTQQTLDNGVYTHQSWSYGVNKAFVVSRSIIKTAPRNVGFPTFSKCDGTDGRDGNGYCELSKSREIPLANQIPYTGTVYDIKLTPPFGSVSTFQRLVYSGITKGGAIHGQYWDYRNGKWNRDDCYTFKALFSDGPSFEVTCPTKDFTSTNDAIIQSSALLRVLGQVPKYARSWLRTIALNGDGAGSRAGANPGRKSMTINLSKVLLANAYTLLLHEGAHVGLFYIQNSAKWKQAKALDPVYISTYAKSSPDHEDVSETYTCWMWVQRYPNSAVTLKIKNAVPNRLAVFDDLVLSRYP